MSALTTASFSWLRQLLHEQSAIALDDSKGYLVENRLQPLALEAGLPSVEAFIDHVRRNRADGAIDEIIDAMTTNETSWLRDHHPWDGLMSTVLPEVMERVGPTRPVRIWSAACSSGQEPYTIAMLVREQFGPGAPVQILASDISEKMLTRARTGSYSQLEVNRGLPAAMLMRWFRREGISWRVVDEIRSMVRFERRNLSHHFGSMPAMDILAMRNVLIYFDLATKQRILGEVRRVIDPHGWLMVGAAETLLDVDCSWKRVPVGPSAFYRPGASPSSPDRRPIP